MRGMLTSGLDFEVAIKNIKTAFVEDEKPLINLGLEKFTENGDTYGIRDKRTQEVYVEPIYDWVDDGYNARTMMVQVRDVGGNRMATELYIETEDESDETRASKANFSNKNKAKIAGGFGQYSGDLSDVLETQVHLLSDKSDEEIIQNIKNNSDIISMMSEEGMSEEDLQNFIKDPYIQHVKKQSQNRQSKINNKIATYFDTYDLIATITVPDGRSNGTYSEIINILNDSQIKYREDERFNEKPDRNVLKILIKKEDAEALEILNKEYKDSGITFRISTVNGEFDSAKMAVKKK
jgi:hypothetical protein